MIHTLCPACGTTFRVTPDQLKAKQGRVRCGQCQHVFNAIETLQEAKPEDTLNSQIETQPEFAVMQELVAVGPVAVAATPEPFIGERDELAWSEMVREPLREVEPPRLRRAWPWALASVLALLALMLQIIIHFRVEVSLWVPSAKPALLVLCEAMGCEVPLPQLSDLVSIETSDLHPDSSQKDRLVLVAMLKNRAAFVQAYPHLELSLTDSLDKAVVRKVLAPAEYLAKEMDSAKGFVANSELAIKVSLSHDIAGSAPATGYRLYLFYP